MMKKSSLSDLSIVFVVDPPVLTANSIILLSSIRHVLGDEVKVTACVPEQKRSFLLPFMTEFYKEMNAEIRFVEPTDRFNPYYKQGNKILACLQKQSTKHTLFLDTDMIIGEKFRPDELFKKDAVSAVPEVVFTWGKEPGKWEQAYQKFGLAVPEEKVQLTSSGKFSLPYFNGGMVAFPTDSDFAESWFHIAAELDADPEITDKRPWLDQIAIPLAIKYAGLKFNVVGEEWNLNIAHPKHEKDLEWHLNKVNGIDGKIVHFHHWSGFNGTRYKAIADTALATHTHYNSLDDFTAEGRDYIKRRAEVWQKVGYLKSLPEKTAEEIAELHQLKQEKDQIKARERDPDANAKFAPESILRAK